VVLRLIDATEEASGVSIPQVIVDEEDSVDGLGEEDDLNSSQEGSSRRSAHDDVLNK
jgi:hypothetical protein